MTDKNHDETIANLNRLLKQERAKRKKLEEKAAKERERVDELERQLDTGVLGWSHREWSEDVHGVKLPVPRVELRWSITGSDEATALYVLVYRHTLGHVEAVPMGQTRCSGGSYRDDDRREAWQPAMFHCRARDGSDTLDTPFRDGVHLLNDARQLGLRAFISTDRGDLTELHVDCDEWRQTWLAVDHKPAALAS